MRKDLTFCFAMLYHSKTFGVKREEAMGFKELMSQVENPRTRKGK